MQLDRIIAVRNSKTVFCDEGHCVKVFNLPYSKTDILKEALNQAYAEEAGLSVPPLLEVTTIDGKWAIVSEYIEGKSLSLLMKENGEKKEEYLALFVSLQLEIQKKSCPLSSGLKERLTAAPHLPELCGEALTASAKSLEALSKETAFCHGDFYPSNVIIREDAVPFVIDWSHAAKGSPLADAAQSYVLFYLRDGEETAEQYLKIYCKKSGTKEESIKKLLAAVAAAQYSKSKEDERKLLLGLIKK